MRKNNLTIIQIITPSVTRIITITIIPLLLSLLPALFCISGCSGGFALSVMPEPEADLLLFMVGGDLETENGAATANLQEIIRAGWSLPCNGHHRPGERTDAFQSSGAM